MPLTASYTRWKLVVLLAGAMAFVLIGVFMIAVRGDAFAIAAGGCSIAFFGLCTIIVLLRFTDRGIVLQIDNTGIFDRRIIDSPVPWTAIAALGEQHIGGQPLYGIILGQPVERFIVSPWKRRLLKANKIFGLPGDLYITGSGLTVSSDQIRKALEDGERRHLVSVPSPPEC